jgi:ElaB/YqjD/DUF883 family membrane-anchored ribosome-binding protein
MANPTTPSKGKDENRTNPTLEKAKDAGSQAFDKAKDIGSQAVDKAKEAASSVAGMVSQGASTVGKTADNLAHTAGTGLKNLGETLGEHTPHEGMLGTASQAVANSLKDGGKYLEDAGLSGVAEDVTQLIRRNPFPAILVGVGIGFLIGRAMRS